MTDIPGEATLFSQQRFIEAVAKSSNAGQQLIKISDPQYGRTMYGLASSLSYGRRSLEFAPFGLFAYPDGPGDISKSAGALVRVLQSVRTTSFYWSVGFDHEILAKSLITANVPYVPRTTHVLRLGSKYEDMFCTFTATVRNQIRSSSRRGLRVREGNGSTDIVKYFELYKHTYEARDGWTSRYPIELFENLALLTEDVLFLVAEYDGLLAAGAWFFRGTSSYTYWHSVLNYDHSRLFPVYAILDRAIRDAVDAKAETFDFGASLGNRKLEEFKSYWGAQRTPYWYFQWSNPIWASASRIRRKLAFNGR